MENPDRKVKKAKRDPRVPIKTYKWEDIKRSRSKGGYPWTYLYKEPYDEELDPEPYTMEGMRKSKSSSTMGKSDIEISEVTESGNHTPVEIGDLPEKSDDLQIITEPDDHSIKCSSSSVVIEECDANNKEKRSPGMFFLDSAESSDDISQYLDKEDHGPADKKSNDCEMDTNTESDNKDEPQNRKRKLSAESSYSRISQTKSAILKKIKDAKAKIKVPKMSFPTSKLKKPLPKKKSNSPPETKKETVKSNISSKNIKPLYIYIPLKPPQGQTDEFSHLEYDTENSKKELKIKPASFRDLVKNIKHLQDVKDIEEEAEEGTDTKEEGDIQNGANAQEEFQEMKLSDDEGDIAMEVEDTEGKGSGEEVAESKENVGKTEADIKESEAKTNTGKERDSEKAVDIDEVANTDREVDMKNITHAEHSEKEVQKPQENIPPSLGTTDSVDSQEKPNDQNQSDATMESEEEKNIPASIETTKYDDMFENLFAASSSRDTETQTIQRDNRKIRSKSAEPERKRKLSLESSYSRKSLSKLGIMKKLRDASEKMKKTLSRASSKKQIEPKEKKETVTPKSKQLKIVKPVEPVYIHIPLKSSNGEADDSTNVQSEDDTKTPDTDSTAPDSPAQTGVHFIFLTAPSDDEVLDYNSSDVAETPSSENKVFFGSRINELKELAKGAVDEISVDKTTQKLDPVSEESNSDKASVEGSTNGKVQIEDLPIDAKGTIDMKKASETKKVEEDVMKELPVVENITSDSAVEDCGKTDIKLPEETTETRQLDKENVQVDEEDGLSEPKTTKKDTSSEDKPEIDIIPDKPENKELSDFKAETTEPQVQELKSSLKIDSPPVMKKKVSFKRRSKVSKDGSYEDVQVVSSEGDANKKELKLIVDGRKDDLDIKNTSLEEDYNKWSKISDHEYEPVNPPPENVEIIPTVKISDNPTVCIINTDQILNNPQTYNFIEEEVYKHDPAFQLKFQKDSKMVHHPGTDAKSKEGPSKFQLAIKQKADNFKTKLHNIKKPHITLPDRPKFHKPNFHKFSLPKIPDTAKINFPSFSLPRRHGAKRPLKERHLSTESNDGDSKKPIFDFSTYPRIFKKKPKDQEPAEQEIPSFATVRRTKKPEKPKTDDSRWSAGSGGSVRVPLHSEDSVEAEYREETEHDKERYVRGDSIEENEPSHIRYDQDIDSDDEYDRENRDLNKERDFLTRWDHGKYNPEDHGAYPEHETYPEHESYPEDYGKYPEDHGKYPVGHGKYQRDHGIYPEDQEEYIQEGQEYIENIINRQPRITDLDSPEDMPERAYQFGNNNGREHYSSGSSQGGHRQGVLEEINPDEFFLRQKGISQDNIEVGKYLSSEIREAFRTPVNALSQMQGKDHDYEMRGSNQSLPEIPAKRKSIKKPKRKKTPHTSQEKIPYDGESGEDELGAIPPSRPKRHSRRTKKQKNADDLIPYQETITVDTVADPRLVLHRESLGILGDDERDEEVAANARMEGKDEPGFRITDPYRNFEYADEDDVFEDVPAAPPRKQKSLKSLNMSENDSIMGDFSSNKAIFSSEKDILEPEIEAIRTESKIIIPIQPNVPKRPSRTISRTNSQSRGTSQMDDESVLSLNAESIVSENQIPCVEEPCVKDLRDSMGYAIIDKSKVRDPPLPPPRIPTRRKRSFRNGNDFFTVPRSSHTADSPVRPLRNYSTLGQSRKSQRSYSNTYENKENIDIDIGQYIEMDDDPARNLQSGAVINKMKDRPLPAPPRPPRKSRPLHDITSQENIHKFGSTTEMIKPEETEMSTQTEPLPDDFICEEVVQEPTDTIIIPSRDLEQKHSSVVSNRTEELISKEALKEPKDLMVVPPRSSNGRKAPLPLSDNQLCEGIDDSPVGRISKATDEFISREVMEKSTPRSQEVKPTIERRLITPTVYTYEETVTHGSLLVKPLDGAKVLPDSDISNVRTIPVHVDSDAEETSSIPEEFNTLRDPSKSARSLEVEKPTAHSTKANEFDVLKAQKLQVVDLDVDKLTVNKLLAQKIIVSEIDSSNIQTNEISSKTGALNVGEISLPPGVIDQIIEKIKSSQVKGLGHQGTEDGCGLQKKTPMNDCPNLCSPQFEADAEIKRNGNSSVSGIHEVSNEPTQLSMQTNPSNMPENLPENVEEIIIDQKCLPETEESLKHQSQGGAPKASPEASDSSFQDKPIEAPNQQYFEESASKPPSDFNTPDLSIGATVQQSLEDQNVEESPPKPPPRAYDFNTVVSVQTPEEQSLEDSDVLETAPKPPPRSSDSPEKIKTDGPAPSRPPRQSGRNRGGSVSTQEESLQEPEVDDEPPPRPPHPQLEYILSQPPASFYALRAQKYVDTLGESAPTVPRRRRQTKSKQLSRSSSEESVPTLIPRRLHRRPSDLSNVSIATLSGQLVRVCGSEVNNSLKRLITYILNNVLRNEDGKQDLNVMIIIVLVLIAGLILLGYGDEKTVVHLHHWEYFNPPRNM